MILPAALCLQEIIFHVFVFQRISFAFFWKLSMAIAFGLFFNGILCLIKEKKRKTGIILITAISFVLLSAQMVYFKIFRTFFSISLVMETISDATEFTALGIVALGKALPVLLLLALPIVAEVFLLKTDSENEEKDWKKAFGQFGAGFFVFLIVLLSNSDLREKASDQFVIDTCMERYGVLLTTSEDFTGYLFPGTVEAAELENAFTVVAMNDETVPAQTEHSVQKESRSLTDDIETDAVELSEEMTEEESSSVAEKEIVYEDQVLPIDFNALIESEKNEAIKTLHQYFSTKQPTKKNAYTGMFEGYNLIVITAEGFSNLAVNEKITPTLYKLVNEGFVFENFYNPIWQTSTSDGEYAVCTGLIPTLSNNMKKSAEVSMPLCMGWTFSDLGYTAKAYHNHSYTYYGRNLSHPNMGYDFIAQGHGMNIKSVWPESDLEMMEAVVDQFIHDEPFHCYFMTVSGHLNYSFIGNSMSSKNKDYVADLEYSEQVKAYFACQREFDLAMEYLIQALEDAGVADRTVIVICGDHYPYGLEMSSINEIMGHEVEQDFELYKSNLVLWSHSMKEPIPVEKYCSSIDILPTIYNLFGVDYDARLLNGRDILSDSDPLVVFKNKSFITDKVRYNARTGETVLLTDEPIEDDYVDMMKKYVKNEFKASSSILTTNYYSYLEEYLK